MNILIEDAESLEYLTSNNQWNKSPAKGKDFGTTKAALAAAKKEVMGKFNIVCFINQSKQFINLDHGRGKSASAESESVAPVPALV
jgi:hypothetical protein